MAISPLHLVYTVALYFCCATAYASLITYEFRSELTTGPLAGTHFLGQFSYESSLASGTGQEFLTLTSLDFTLEGVKFRKADLSQGGQVITENGKASFFTAAFFPPPPQESPVNNIAFGFGGPGVIGYSGPTGAPGSGFYSLTLVPEPEVALIIVVGGSLLLGLRRQAMLQSL